MEPGTVASNEQAGGDSKELSFIQRLARYYSDFLETDFKKGTLPKRRFLTRDKKARRFGIPLEKFSSFISPLRKSLSGEFSQNCTFQIKPKMHQAQLPGITLAAIEAEIESIDFESLSERVNTSVDRFKVAISKDKADLEAEQQNFITSLEKNVAVVIGAELINRLTPVFEKSASNLMDSLASVDDDVSELLVTPITEAVGAVAGKLLRGEGDAELRAILDEAFSSKKIQEELRIYFESFSAGDLSTEVRELMTVERLDDNLEFYLYIGEIRYNNNEFPIFYIPIKIESEGSTVTLSLEPRLLVNKKAIDYMSLVVQEKTNTKGASPVDKRIIYVSPNDCIFNLVTDLFYPVLSAFQINGDFSFEGPQARLSNSTLAVTNSLKMALFDKSDESMLTDYEELLERLGEGAGGLLSFVEGLVNGFLKENPKSIKSEIYDEWEETSLSEKLVFDTPIPLAEEQRKILSAIRNGDGRFITVEGPPGTGKSHTISAIAFEAILTGKSILVLSDKKEALDVVENKLNDTLAKVRPSDDFVNPILRLGRVGTNFKKIITNKSIETLRTQNRESKKEEGEREKRYQEVVTELKENISRRTDHGLNIDLEEIFRHERKWAAFLKEWSADLDGFEKFMDSPEHQYQSEIETIRLLLDVRQRVRECPEKLLTYARQFGDDASSLAMAIRAVGVVNKKAQETKLFELAPAIEYQKIRYLADAKLAIQGAKGVFGYLFSGKKLREIEKGIYQEVGFSSGSANAEGMISELTNLEELASNFYHAVHGKLLDKNEELIASAMSVADHDRINEDLVARLDALNEAINLGDLPFLGSDESVLDMLSANESGEINFYADLLQLKDSKKQIELRLEAPDYDFIGRKKEIENFNVLKLATEIDSRVIHFADNFKNDAKTLATIISEKKKFPREKFDLLKQAFPCIICSLRDYAEYIPLERELFDIIIIDEASQVSIAQAFPAIVRAKKLIVMGDKRQFGNVKTANASKEQNNASFQKVKSALSKYFEEVTSDLDIRVNKLNISNSILDFMENLSNFDIMLRKHFRGYPEMISFSSKYFYGNSLQAMKIRGKPISEVLEFINVEHDGVIDPYRNTNRQEIDLILSKVLEQLDSGDLRSVAVITPFTEQQTLVSTVFAEHERYEEILQKLKFRSFTFDSCQGEERDIIYFSFVASPEKDRLWAVLPKSLNAQDEEDLDSKKKLQRMNVAFSRGKEKLVFVLSKPIADLSGGKDALVHYANQINLAKQAPTKEDVDPNSVAEQRVLEWIQQMPLYVQHQPEIQTQFELGRYLSTVDANYNQPMYRVDFLLRFDIEGKQRDIIIEYDGFEFHFDNREEIDSGNWRHFQKASDIEREHTLESYGYKTIRLNKFNIGPDPVETLNSKIKSVLAELDDPGDALVKKVLSESQRAHSGLFKKGYKTCKQCNEPKPKEDFKEVNNKAVVFGLYCKDCRETSARKKKKKSANFS